jgi:tetratricopeptide (TPR) repeat protein
VAPLFLPNFGVSPDETLSLAASLVAHGQSLENQNPPALADAVRAYDDAIVRLRTLPLAHERIRRDLAVALMNRGNALQRQDSPASVAAALCAYDEAIAFFRTLPLADFPDYRNALGAAWMNRGHALHRQPDSAGLVEAIRSHGEAVALLRTLPLDANRSYPINLAAAWMNQANALLLLGEPARALASAREAISVAAPAESTDPALADLSLKARRAWCEAAGRLLVAPDAYLPAREPLAD